MVAQEKGREELKSGNHSKWVTELERELDGY